MPREVIDREVNEKSNFWFRRSKWFVYFYLLYNKKFFYTFSLWCS